MDLKDYIAGFLLGALFLVALFTFAFGIAGENDLEGVYNTDKIDLTSLENRLESSRVDANSYMESFSSENPLESFGALVFFSIVGIAKLVSNSVITIFTILFGGISNVLGIPPLVTGTISAILLIGLIMAAWKLHKTGI